MRDQKDWLEAEEDSKDRADSYEADVHISRSTVNIAIELANLNANICAIGHLHNIDYTASFMIDIIRGR